MTQNAADKPLTPQQERFCEEYIIDLNATAAAERAEYSDPAYGRQLITKPNVEKRISELKDARSERTQITADRVLQELAQIAFSNLDDFASWGGDVEGNSVLVLKDSKQLTRAQKSVIKSVKHTRKRGKAHEDTLEIVREDKLSALDKLAKHLNLYNEHQQSGQTGLTALVEHMARRKADRDAERSEDA